MSQAEAYVDAVFTQVVSAQKYLPKYLVSTTAYPGGNQSGPVHFSPDALPNITAWGSCPARRRLGRQADRRAGRIAGDMHQDGPKHGGAAAITGDAKYFNLNSSYSLCDTFNAISFVLTNNGNKFGLGDMAAGFQKVLAKGVSTSGVGGTYGGGNFRHDGLGVGQSLAHNSTTKHFNYVGSTLSIT